MDLEFDCGHSTGSRETFFLNIIFSIPSCYLISVQTCIIRLNVQIVLLGLQQENSAGKVTLFFQCCSYSWNSTYPDTSSGTKLKINPYVSPISHLIRPNPLCRVLKTNLYLLFEGCVFKNICLSFKVIISIMY